MPLASIRLLLLFTLHFSEHACQFRDAAAGCVHSIDGGCHVWQGFRGVDSCQRQGVNNRSEQGTYTAHSFVNSTFVGRMAGMCCTLDVRINFHSRCWGAAMLTLRRGGAVIVFFACPAFSRRTLSFAQCSTPPHLQPPNVAQFGETPLLVAAQRGHAPVVSVLLEAKAPIEKVCLLLFRRKFREYPIILHVTIAPPSAQKPSPQTTQQTGAREGKRENNRVRDTARDPEVDDRLRPEFLCV